MPSRRQTKSDNGADFHFQTLKWFAINCKIHPPHFTPLLPFFPFCKNMQSTVKNLLFQHFDSFLLYFHTKTQSQFALGLKTKMIGFLQICVDLCSRMDVRRGSFGPACIKVHTRVRLIYLHCDLERIILKPIDQG